MKLEEAIEILRAIIHSEMQASTPEQEAALKRAREFLNSLG